jgi:hypothetical protein
LTRCARLATLAPMHPSRNDEWMEVRQRIVLRASLSGFNTNLIGPYLP